MTKRADTPASDAAHAGIDPAAVVDLAAELVRIRSVNDPGAAAVEAPVADRIAGLMTDFGWDVTVTPVADGRPNVVGVIHGASAGRTLMFEGHTDVVTEGDPASWTFPPYAGDVVGGNLRGRGSADMKGGLAAMIHAARAIQLRGFAGRLIVAALADEEGMMAGAKAFAASDLAKTGIDGVIVCEPEAGEICTVAKGALRVTIDYTGAMAHGAMPQAGRNPIPAIGQLLVGVSELERQLRHSVGAHPQLGEFCLTPTVLAAGEAAQQNVIPATARVLLDIRTVPETPHADLLRLLGRLADQIAAEAGLTCRLTVTDDRPCVETPHDAAVVRALAAAHRRITGDEPVFGGAPGTTDGTILARDAGLTTVVYGPGGKWIAHQADEVCRTDDIVTAARVYAHAAQLFFEEDT